MKTNYLASVLLRILSGTALILAIGAHPSSFYALLRWLVTASCLYSGWVMSTFKKTMWAWGLFIIAVLFNPLIPVYLDRPTWQLIDIVASLILFASFTVKIPRYGKSI